ncbi:MAG: SCO family protein [Deltaproteobacteria bacterium]|nr:SCO family protein [Deltaproteobacteria bacterium]
MLRYLPAFKTTKILFLTFIFLIACSSLSYAITNTQDLNDVGVDEKLGEAIPLDLTFTNEEGKPVKLGDFFEEDKPVILTLVYYECPRLCTFILNGVLDAVNGLSSLSLGKDFKIVSVSFNPDESYQLAAKKASNYYKGLENSHFPKGNWHFLTGDEENIGKLTQAVGFKYKKDGEEFAHPSTIIILTPKGEISRYLYGVQYEPKDLKLALLEASNGEIGSSRILNKVLLFCYHFDPVGKKYALQALNVVKAGGVVTLLSLVGLLTYFWKKEKKESQ